MRIAVQQSLLGEHSPAVAQGYDIVLRAGEPIPESAAELGAVAVLSGDEVFDVAALKSLATERPDVLVLRPGSESELQAEGVLEWAIGLSDAVAGLVIIVEDDGAEPGDPGHGGSAIVLLGDVIAEAMSGADLIDATVGVPVPQPVPRNPLPELPTILAQRVAHHAGRHVPVEYPADA